MKLLPIAPDDDVDKFLNEEYIKLHEKQGLGLRKDTTGWGLTFHFIREDGSLYIDVVPVLVSDAFKLQQLAHHVPGIVISNFEATHPNGIKNYSVGTDLYYKH